MKIAMNHGLWGLWYVIKTKVNCMRGKHDWCFDINPVTLKGDERECINCPAKQKVIDGKWRYI